MTDAFGELREALNAPTIDVDAAEDALAALAQEHGHDNPQVMEAKEMTRRAYAGILRRVTDQDPVVTWWAHLFVDEGGRITAQPFGGSPYPHENDWGITEGIFLAGITVSGRERIVRRGRAYPIKRSDK